MVKQLNKTENREKKVVSSIDASVSAILCS